MLELLIISCILILIGFVYFYISDDLLRRLVSIKLIASGFVLFSFSIISRAAAEYSSFVVITVSIVSVIVITFVGILSLKYYTAREKSETSDMVL